MAEVVLRVDAMRCRRCVREVTARLRDAPGVALVSADSDRCVVRLVGEMTVAAVLGALAGTPYRATVLGPTES